MPTTAVEEAIRRGGVPGSDIGHVVMGNVVPTESRDAYLSRVAAIESGLPKETPLFKVSQLCWSGLQAVMLAAQRIMRVETLPSKAGRGS